MLHSLKCTCGPVRLGGNIVSILYKKFNSIKYLALSSFWNQGKWLCVKCLRVTRQILLPSHLADAVKRDRGGKPWKGSDCRLHFLMLQPSHTHYILHFCVDLTPDLSQNDNIQLHACCDYTLFSGFLSLSWNGIH